MICAHDACTCAVEDGLEYCGPSCRMGIDTSDTGEACKCGHAECVATIGQG